MAENWEYHYFYGVKAWAQGDRAAAQTSLEQSLAIAPAQGRVRVELGLFLAEEDPAAGLPYLEEIPAVYDLLAATAVTLFRLGYEAEAHGCLIRLDEPEAEYDQRLISPQARKRRLRQAQELRAYLAEKNHLWLEAWQRWHDLTGAVELNLADSLAGRAHLLFLLGQYFGQESQTFETTADRALYTLYQKELAKLSLRKLLGDAMFYRSLAVGVNQERAVADWRALLRQKEWVARTQNQSPWRLLLLGDRLAAAGMLADAEKAYTLAGETAVLGASTRLFLIQMARADLPQIKELLTSPAAAALFATDEADFLFLQTLCHLAEIPPAYGMASAWLSQAKEAGLTESLLWAGEWLLAFPEPPGNNNMMAMAANLPITLQQGLKIQLQPETMVDFAAIYSRDWQEWFPWPPQLILAWQIHQVYEHGACEEALRLLEAAASAGIPVPAAWRVFLYLSHAIQLARQGDFALALETQQKALLILEEE
jgi:hypothetical protein